MILIDQPNYWFRGRRWCHMVSDSNLDELHAFAAGLGIPRKGFQDNPFRNHPHYDLPLELRDQAVAAGAVEVTGSQLVRRMYRYPDRPRNGRRRNSSQSSPAGR